MFDMTDGADINVRFGSLKLLFCDCYLLVLLVWCLPTALLFYM